MSSTTKRRVSGTVKPATRKPVPGLDGAGSSKQANKQEKRDNNFLDGEFDEDGAKKDEDAPPDPYATMLGTFFTAVLDSFFPAAAADRNKDLPKTPSDRDKKLPNEKTCRLFHSSRHSNTSMLQNRLGS